MPALVRERVFACVCVWAERAPLRSGSNYVALDCEMVGIGKDGMCLRCRASFLPCAPWFTLVFRAVAVVCVSGVQSSLARCSLVGFGGEVLYDRYVRQTEKVTGKPCSTDNLTHTHTHTHVCQITART